MNAFLTKYINNREEFCQRYLIPIKGIMKIRGKLVKPDSNIEAEINLPLHVLAKIIKLIYMQSVLGTIYLALTSGMFLIGYALKLGANDAQIGLMTTVPMFCVVGQLAASYIIERGYNRKTLTIGAALISTGGWAIVMILPLLLPHASTNTKISILIAIVTVLTLFAHASAIAKFSWLGDLIPSSSRGEFFGKCIMYANIVATIFSVAGGRFLDYAKKTGVGAFSIIFLAAVICGIINTLLYLPQNNMELKKHKHSDSMLKMIKSTFTNKPLVIVTIYAVLWFMQAIATPFIPTYMLRDLHVTYFGMGLVTAAATLTVLISSSFWGKMIDIYGCRPVLIACTIVCIPLPLVWIWVTKAVLVYYLIIPANIIGGFAISGITVALSALLYNVTPNAGRSVQVAIYSIVVILLAAPMPVIGGHLPEWLKSAGINTDLRCTFWASQIFLIAAAFTAAKINEANSRHTRELASNLVNHIFKRKT